MPAVSRTLCLQILELLGKSLWDLYKQKGTLTARVLSCVAIEAITMLQDMHQRGCAVDAFMFVCVRHCCLASCHHECLRSGCHDMYSSRLQLCAWGRQT